MALSGGLNSSMIVAASVNAFTRNTALRTPDKVVQTFTLGFNEPTDENEDAAGLAEHFGTEHHDTRLSTRPMTEAGEAIRSVEEPKINMLQGTPWRVLLSHTLKCCSAVLVGMNCSRGMISIAIAIPGAV